ncbi:SMC family ATPase [Dysgonomonas sp. 520]|uniref:SMC family ATPase n=1 Tax=Dysgonomonas sp. 520 TaxID=2302931 RepID=UPI0013D817E7|nr:SMC family ATPase [Dysgonomonas sp. 520]NDW11003.1 SMC family ATPase [Dysgonomonas sp. 520]
MWKLTEIYAQNICAFRELHYTLTQGVTTLVFGNNRDNESQQSNGSGKSALIECIAIGITGSPLRKIKNEEIINDNSDECMIELQFKSDCNNETFIIERKLFRKSPAEIACYVIRGQDFDPEEAIEPSIDAYNKFILEKLGISKDELYNNFILSKHKYQNFLSCPDREKKEIINRFSNGILVDRAIEKILEDKIPFEKTLKETELEEAGINGRIEMLTEQIEREEVGREEKTRTKDEKIAGLENTIREKRSLIREKTQVISSLQSDEEKLKSADKYLQELENGDLALEECIARIETELIPVVPGKLTDWNSVIAAKKKQLEDTCSGLKEYDAQLIACEKDAKHLDAIYSELNGEYASFNRDYDKKNSDFEKQLQTLNEQVSALSIQNEEQKRYRRTLSSAIETLNNKIAGTITCPACGHEFIVSDKNFDVVAGREELDSKKKEYESVVTCIGEGENNITGIEDKQRSVQKDRRELSNQKSIWADRLSDAGRDVKNAIHKTEEILNNQKRIKDRITSLQEEINTIRRKIFDEAFDLLDEGYKTIERKKNSLQEDIRAGEGSIEMLEKTIGEIKNNTEADIIASLKTTLKEFRQKSSLVFEKKIRIENELHTLEEQGQHFVMFKTYLANTKIEALSKITNEFLEDIGSDIRIKFSGYTVLKTGKVREKISVSLVRSGLDCGSFGKFSEGEAARVNLATILAMQKLVNSNCDVDKGLDLLVLDEILEAVDEEGLAHMFEALNRIGITSLIVSHGNIAESYPHKIKIIKENGESKIEA